jgi:DNA primase
MLGFEDKIIDESGLFSKGSDGSRKELFYGRLQFPIFDPYGSIVGFGGRILTKGNPKYLNTPKTSIFDKSSLLYGMHIAKNEIILQGTGVVVEGYMDVLTANQHGFRNVVACMGTALTQQQVSHLTGICTDVVLALDPDRAGQEAILRSLETSWKVFNPPVLSSTTLGSPNYRRVSRQINLRIAVLPSGLDPDDLIRENPQQWSEAISQSSDLIEFLFDVLPSRYDLTTSEGKLQLVERFAPLILSIESPSSQDKILENLEHLLKVDRATLEDVLGLTHRALVRKRKPNGRIEDHVTGSLAPLLQVHHDPLEEYTLVLLLLGSDAKDEINKLSSEFFQRIENRELFTVWMSCDTIDEVKANLDQNLVDHLEALASKSLPPLDSVQRKEALAHCIRRLEERYLRDLKLQEGLLLSSSDETELGPLSMEGVLDRNRRLRNLFQRPIRE